VQQDQADRVGDRRQRVLVAATTVGNEIAGRLAVKTNSGVLTDAVDVTADSDGAPVTE
jgi:electron transfer flavoprotein alpha subunit